MKKKNKIIEKIIELKPVHILDTGCGLGDFTALLSPYCGKITAIDIDEKLIEYSKKNNKKQNITYLTMDGTSLPHKDNSFDLVLSRATLHHSHNWEKVLDEAVRISSSHIIVAEPLDSERSPEKKNTLYGMKFFSKPENNLGFPHYEHFKPEILINYFERRNIKFEVSYEKSDKIIKFDDYFKGYIPFVELNNKKDFFLNRLEILKKELKGENLCQNDVIYIFAKKF